VGLVQRAPRNKTRNLHAHPPMNMSMTRFILNSVVEPIYLVQTTWASSVVARQLLTYVVNAEIR